MRAFLTAIAAAAAILGATSAQAVTCGDSTFTTAVDCIGPVSGNNSNDDLTGFFDFTNGYGDIMWGSEIKVNNGTGGTTGILSFSSTTTDGSGGGLTGDWSVSSWSGITAAMIVLKGGPSYSAYLIDLTAGTMGTWDTLGIVKGSGGAGPGLSHMSLYVATGPTAPVPLPAAGGLLLAGLGGLIAARRRRKTD